MRVGQNPAKSIESVPQPARVTVAIVTYIPFLSGYYEQNLEVLKVCLNSLWDNTPQPYDLLVFDNASCAEVRAFLSDAHDHGRIQYLLFSDRNVGKGGAWNFIFQGAPGEIIAYSDSDVQFFKGWLEQSLDILDTFPHTGMVTARPLRTPEKFFTSTIEWAQKEPEAHVEKGQYLTWDVFKQHNESLGTSEQQNLEWFQSGYDWRIAYKEKIAFAGAAHFQFVSPKSVLQNIGSFKMDRPMGQVRLLDEKLNQEGFLRLTTCEPLVRHMGNRLLADAGNISAPHPESQRKLSFTRRIAQLPLIRRSLLWLYNRIFRLYFDTRT